MTWRRWNVSAVSKPLLRQKWSAAALPQPPVAVRQKEIGSPPSFGAKKVRFAACAAGGAQERTASQSISAGGAGRRRRSGFVMGDDPVLLPARLLPFAIGWQRLDHLHIGLGRPRNRKVINVEAVDHRGVHGVGGAEGPEQERPGGAIIGAAVLPHLV